MTELRRIKEELEFSNNWFEVTAEKIWRVLLPQMKPKKVLEIGSFEGRSACQIIIQNDWSPEIELHCVDSWEGGVEHKSNFDMVDIEKRFDKNIKNVRRLTGNRSSVYKHKGTSLKKLVDLIADGHTNSFDFIYIDGSHQAPDVLSDAILSFNLLKVGGVIGFDDYTWAENLSYGIDPIRTPKISIDAFTNIFIRKIRILNTSNQQVYVQKVTI